MNTNTLETPYVTHFTDSLSSLWGILKYGFRPKYCKEIFASDQYAPACIAVPMVSLCDIPIELTKRQSIQYGRYAISLKKTWAIQNGYMPVPYIPNRSPVTSRILQLLFAGHEMDRMDFMRINQYTVNEDMLYVLKFCKNYDGEVTLKDGRIHFGYKYYEEREWRYVLPDEKILDYDEYEEDKDRFNIPIQDKYLLFDAIDLQSIYVSVPHDVEKLLRRVNMSPDLRLKIQSDNICTLPYPT